jgi:hypothetical protein
MNLELSEQEKLTQQEASLRRAAHRMTEAEGGNLPVIDELYAHVPGVYASGLLEAGASPAEYMSLFLGIEELAKLEPELAFALSYHYLCRRVAAVLLEKDLCQAAFGHLHHSRSVLDTLLIWPAFQHEASITGVQAQFHPESKRLTVKDRLLPLPASENAAFLGWAEAGGGATIAFCVPVKHGHKNEERRVRCMGLNRIAFHQIEWTAVPEQGAFMKGRQEFPREYHQLEAERNLLYGAVLSGLLQALLTYAVNYSRKRKTFGKPLFLHQAVAMSLAEMKVETEAMRLLLLDAIQHITGDEIRNYGSSFRQYLANAALQTSTQAMQVLGGHGLLDDHPVEKWIRDVQTLRLLLE